MHHEDRSEPIPYEVAGFPAFNHRTLYLPRCKPSAFSTKHIGDSSVDATGARVWSISKFSNDASGLTSQVRRARVWVNVHVGAPVLGAERWGSSFPLVDIIR